MNLITKLRGALRSVTMWVNGLFLAALPFADEIVLALNEYLPALQPYLPENAFKAVCLALAIFNLYQRTRTSTSLAVKGAK